MNRFKKIFFYFPAVCCFIALASVFPDSVSAENAVDTDVLVIHASQNQNHIDPELTDLAEELSSVFKYTSYRLLKTKNMRLGKNQTGRVTLPGRRTLSVTPVNITGEKIKYQITIHKTKNQIFGTQIILKNNRSITIGGPRFRNGFLLFNITGRSL